MQNNLMIFENKKQAVVSSRTVADKFEKQHKNVLQSIEWIIKSAEISADLFYESSYLDGSNRKQREYLLTRDGFSLLVMGFTGKEALNWKIKYIQAFNAMEALIKEKQSSEWLITRRQGKLIRRNETDVLAALADYAEEQGSKNMRKQVYTIYTKLVNSLVGIDAGMRDSVPFKTLSTIMFIEDMIMHTITEEMQNGTYYKEIYKKCKSNGLQIAQFAYLPKLSA